MYWSTLLTYSMEQSHWEANRFVAIQGIPRILWNPKVQYRIHSCPPNGSILSQPNPVHTTTSHFFKIYPDIILPSTRGSPQWPLSFRLPHQTPIHTSLLPIRATCPAHLILIYFITRTILGEEYISWSFSLWGLLHSPATSSLLEPNILLNTLFTNTLSLRFSVNISDKV
jgi:hypothetical protein